MALSEVSKGEIESTVFTFPCSTTDNNQKGSEVFSHRNHQVRWLSTYNSVPIITSHIPSKELVAMLIQYQFQ